MQIIAIPILWKNDFLIWTLNYLFFEMKLQKAKENVSHRLLIIKYLKLTKKVFQKQKLKTRKEFTRTVWSCWIILNFPVNEFWQNEI